MPFQIVGVGKLEDQIRKYISEKKINVTLRKASHEEMPTIYNESSIIVNPLIMKGSWIGNITLEAMACGKCLIKSSDYLSRILLLRMASMACCLG
jgi:glycosyltransferase involved in cell wall biosynthesis